MRLRMQSTTKAIQTQVVALSLLQAIKGKYQDVRTMLFEILQGAVAIGR
jgi:hypothetical protein